MEMKMDKIKDLKEKLAELEKEYGVKLSTYAESAPVTIENNSGRVITIPPARRRSTHPGESKAEKEFMNQEVSIRLFKDNSRYKDDLFVAVNGDNCVIKRGVWVKVKRKFALVIDQSLIQDQMTGDYMDDKAREFARESVERNI